MNRLRKLLGRTRRRGSSLIEVLIAMTILAMMMVGILEMYSLSLVVNAGSAARTQMTFKAQQVVENLRLVYGMYRASAPQFLFTAPAGSNIPLPASPGGIVADTTYTLPYDSSDAAAWAFWGPAGANVMEVENGPYTIKFNVTNDAGSGSQSAEGTIVTVTVEAVTSGTTGRRYFGNAIRSGSANATTSKRIDYVARIIVSPR